MTKVNEENLDLLSDVCHVLPFFKDQGFRDLISKPKMILQYQQKTEGNTSQCCAV